MSLVGKIFAILNVLAAIGFVVIAGMDYSQRHRWAYTVYRHQLLLDGLPIDDAEKDVDGTPRVRAFDEPWFAEMFQRAGGNPVKTQQAEVQELQRRVQTRVDDPDVAKGTKTQKLAQFATALAETYPQRKAAMRQMGPAGTRTDDLSADLSSAYATILDARKLTRDGHDIIRSIREKASDPNPHPGEIAARLPFGEQAAERRKVWEERRKDMESKGLIELQVGRDPVVLAMETGVPFPPAEKEGVDVFVTVGASAADKLQTILTANFETVSKGGSLGARKDAAARLMFCLGTALTDDPNGDFFATPAYPRLAIVAGLAGASQAIDNQATAYRRMIQEYVSDYQGGAMGDHEFDLRQFVGEHNQIVANTIGLAERAEYLKRLVKEKERDRDKQLVLVQKRQAEITDLRNKLDKDLRQQTADKLAEQSKAEQEIRDRLIELRDTGRTNQELEREIRRLETEPTEEPKR